MGEIARIVVGVSLALCLLAASTVQEITATTALCNATTTENVQYEYKTDVVNSEHIVSFRGYFSKLTRDKYVTAALNNAGVSINNTHSTLLAERCN